MWCRNHGTADRLHLHLRSVLCCAAQYRLPPPMQKWQLFHRTNLTLFPETGHRYLSLASGLFWF